MSDIEVKEMQAVVVQDDRSLRLDTVARPEPGPRQVRVRVAACGICGSDLHMRRSSALPAGSVMGHEFSGTVDATGEGVSLASEGDRVVVFPARPTPEHDLTAVLTTSIGGPGHAGGFAEWVIVDEDMLWNVPDDLSLEHAALTEPLAVALHGIDIARLSPGDAAAIIGAGPIGLLVASALRAVGHQDFVIVERNPDRRARAERLGFRALDSDDVHTTLPAALGRAPKRVFECAGHPSAPNLAIELVDVSGRIALMGFLEEHVPISQLSLMLKEAELCSTWGYRPPNFDKAIELLRTGAVPASELITTIEPLANISALFDELASPNTEHIKVLVTPGVTA